MSLDQEMKLVELEMQVRSLTMTITQMRNVVVGAVQDMDDGNIEDAYFSLSQLCPCEDFL